MRERGLPRPDRPESAREGVPRAFTLFTRPLEWGKRKKEFPKQNPTVEQRLSALEKRVAELSLLLTSGGRVKDWRRTVGMFSGDEVMKEIFEEALKYRERDREKARRKYARTEERKPRKKKPA